MRLNREAVKNGIRFIAVLFIYLSVSTPALGGFQLPNDAYRMYELDNAIENAVQGEWALAFVLSDENTGCSLATNASIAVFDELTDRSIFVYVAMKENKSDLPKVVRDGFSSPKSGRWLPITVITNPNATKVIDIIPYHRNSKEHLKCLAQSKEKIDGYFRTSPIVKYSIPVVAGALVLLFFRKRKL